MRALLLGLGLALASSSAAQGSEFYPLAEGDMWTYEQSTDVNFGSFDSFTGYRRVEARGDTLIAGETYRLVDVTSLDHVLRTTATARCAVRVQPATETPEWIALHGDCGADEAGLSFSEPPATGDYTVGGIPYTGPIRIGRLSGVDYAVQAFQIGLVYGMTPFTDSGDRRLQRLHVATVGGTTYGAPLDSTAWREFAPLAVGTRHLYHRSSRHSGAGYYSRSVVSATSIDGRDYAVVAVQNYSLQGVLLDTQTVYERYRDARGCVVRLGSETCSWGGMDEDLRLRSKVEPGAVIIGGQTVARPVFRDTRRTGFADGYVSYASGIGLVSYHSGSAGGPGGGSWDAGVLEYAQIEGESYGTLPAWVTWPVAGEPLPSSARLALRLAGANPTRGIARLLVESATSRTVELTVTDILGRVVERRSLVLSPGTTPVAVNLQPHADGVYRVRVAEDGRQAATLAVTHVRAGR